MADDNIISIGDIRWEYADYTPEEEEGAAPRLSAPAPVQPAREREAEDRAPAEPARPAPRRNEYLPANAPPPEKKGTAPEDKGPGGETAREGAPVTGASQYKPAC